MGQYTNGGFREESARELDPISEDLIKSAPTEPEAFLRWAEQRRREEGKFELSRGRVVCNAIFASSLHSRVIRNLVIELGHLLDLDQFETGISDFAVRTPFGVRSPDIIVERVKPQRALSTTTPIFIVEVLSPSTANTDFTEKLQEYTAMDTLRTYLICSQDEPHACVWARQADGSWPARPIELAGRDGKVAIAGLDIELTMAPIFRGIPDAPTVE